MSKGTSASFLIFINQDSLPARASLEKHQPAHLLLLDHPGNRIFIGFAFVGMRALQKAVALLFLFYSAYGKPNQPTRFVLTAIV
jgi:hypothetical protein